MSNRTESVLKDFCKKVSDSTITNPVNTDYDKLFEMLDDDYGKTGADKKKIGVVITQEELNKLEAENEKLRREVDEAEHDRDEFSMDLVDTVAKNKKLIEALKGMLESYDMIQDEKRIPQDTRLLVERFFTGEITRAREALAEAKLEGTE